MAPMTRWLIGKIGTIAVVVAVTFVFVPATAQTSTGILQGVVQDATGGVVPDAKVLVTNVSTNEVRELRTDTTGRYVLPYLLPGTYELSVEKTGFRTLNS